MNEPLWILAKSNSASAAHSAGSPLSFERLLVFPKQNEVLGLCQSMDLGTALLFAMIGLIFLLYGWAWFKPLFTLNAAVVGAFIGAVVGGRAGGYAMAGGIAGAVIAASIAWPLMKWAVAVMGGLCGAFVGSGVWLASGQDPNFAWAGALTGLVGFGMLSFVVFRGSIITYTSFQGAMMLIIGALGLLLKYPDWKPTILQHITAQPIAMPVAVLIAAVLGLIYQQTHSQAGAPEKK